ncbi:MAG: hypothetical protein IK118_08420 [Clostridia bacterium]|nr:hypothetical protein [Clostridia bacterium]
MIVIRDGDTAEQTARPLLQALEISQQPLTINGSCDFPAIAPAERVLLLTTMSNGWLGYHKAFFDANKGKAIEWIVVLLQEDQYVLNQLRVELAPYGQNACIFAADPRDGDWNAVAQKIRARANIKKNKALLVSMRTGSGKRSLAALLKQSLPDWSFETAVINRSAAGVPETDAAHLIIVGRTADELRIRAPEQTAPFFVLTMPDRNVQAYLQRDYFPEEMLRQIEKASGITAGRILSRFYFVSPLYESWRRTDTVAKEDSRLVMWDEFGLPRPHSEYSDDNIRRFLASFNQCDALARALRSENDA